MWIDKLGQMKKESGMTLDDIIEKSKVSKGTLNKIFAGQTKDPQLSSIKAIVHAMGYTLDDLEDKIKKSPTPGKAEVGGLSEDKKELIDDYDKLNFSGKRAAQNAIKGLTCIPEYQNSKSAEA